MSYSPPAPEVYLTKSDDVEVWWWRRSGATLEAHTDNDFRERAFVGGHFWLQYLFLLFMNYSPPAPEVYLTKSDDVEVWWCRRSGATLEAHTDNDFRERAFVGGHFWLQDLFLLSMNYSPPAPKVYLTKSDDIKVWWWRRSGAPLEAYTDSDFREWAFTGGNF
jgi:uncharacterized protein (UPF0303 family)